MKNSQEFIFKKKKEEYTGASFNACEKCVHE